MRHYNISGMSCAACSARVEKAVSAVDGVTQCTVNLLTNSMVADGTASDAAIIAAVENAGYGASRADSDAKSAPKADDGMSFDKEINLLKHRLIWSLVLLAVLMYFSMGHMMWGWPLPPFFDGNHVAMGLAQLLLTIGVMVINQKFFISGFKSVKNKAPNMDTLVSLGAGASFIYSTYALFAMTGAQVHGDSELAMHYMHEFYFESAAMILALITLGKMLEARSKGKTTNALKGLMELSPKTAVIERDGKEITVPAEEVQKGDIFIVRPGDSIPADGIVTEGSSAVNEAALTGESIPADKTVGDKVSAATVNQSGYIKCRATDVGADTTLSKIIRMVGDAAATKAPIAKIADRVSAIFVPTVITIAVVTTVAWMLFGASFGYALARGISVLVISCPCALGLATPVAIMVGNGVGAKHNILFKTAAALEETGRIKTVVLDKTGTVTTGKPTVTDIVCAGGTGENELIESAYSLEAKSEHPLAKAVVEYAAENGLTARATENFTALPGNGLTGEIDGTAVYGGNMNFIKTHAGIDAALITRAEELSSQGKTPLFFCTDKKTLGIIAVSDVIKDDSAEAISELRAGGIRVVMLTGDNRRTAEAIAKTAGIDEVIADVLPDGKESAVSELMKDGKVAMVGDGINDAPALTRADIGIAIGAGVDIAIDAADVVLMKSSLSDVVSAIKLSRATLRNIHENLFWAFIYNVLGIPLAAGVFIHAFGWQLNPMFGAAAMSLSSFCVVTNALRLNTVRLGGKRGTKSGNGSTNIKKNENAVKIENIEKHEKTEGKKMTKTLKIEGMMCGHCEARVKKCLEEIDGVQSAEVSHEKGTAVVTLTKDVPFDTLKAAVEAQDYKVVG